MSTRNFYDIPDCFREKLNTTPVHQEEVDLTAQNQSNQTSDEENVVEIKTDISAIVDEDVVLTAQNQGCRGGNCASPPPPPCRGGNCAPPPPPRPHFPQYPFHPCPMGGPCRKKNIWMTPMPYFRAYPGSLRMQTEMEDWQDWDNLKERYPRNSKIIKNLVDEQADRMEYDGSMMFDEYPDETRIEKIVDEIYQRFITELQNEAENNMNQNSNENQNNDENEMFEGTCVRCDNTWSEEALKELIMVVLFHEMYQRRCKNRRCNRWW